MKTWTAQALKLLVAASLTEREALTAKLAELIERYRDNPEKSEQLAETIIGFFENLANETSTSYAASPGAPASKEDIGLLMFEIQKLKNELETLKQVKHDA